MVNDIVPFEPVAFGNSGSRRYIVEGNSTSINPGEPVSKKDGYKYAVAMAINQPLTAYVVGIASSVYTSTATDGATVDVIPALPGVIYLIKPYVAATYGLTPGSLNQATYNTQIGNRVLMDLSGGAYTLLAADSAVNGCAVEYVEVAKSNGRVAFSFRNGFTFYGY